MREEFLAQHVPRLLGKVTEKDSEWWLPQEHELISEWNQYLRAPMRFEDLAAVQPGWEP